MYLSACHPDVMDVLDTKRENADEKIRIKSLSIGLVIPDIVMQKATKGEDYYTFSPLHIQQFYNTTLSDINITEMYDTLVNDPRVRKKKISARGLLTRIAELETESGYPYVMFLDTVNAMNAIDGWISMSNLCVAPETRLLTDKGEFPIITLAGQTVNVWNGEEFSEVTVQKTGEGQSLKTVSLSDGTQLDVTDYHKWYLQDGFSARGTMVEKRTHELEPGDRLIKWERPTLEGTDVMDRAYMHGFITGDGTDLREGVARIYLYGDKMSLVTSFEDVNGWRHGGGDLPRLETEVPVSHVKYFVPGVNYTLRSRLDWLAGWLDADGSVYRNGTNEALVGSSVNFEFLQELQSMLMMSGIQSRINFLRPAGKSHLPMNDGTGRYDYYQTQAQYRLTISSAESQKLLAMGLHLKRLKIEVREVNRSAAQFVTVVDIQDFKRISDTYCLTEPKRGMAVFNGVLTGNCSEILQTSSASELNADLSYKVVGKDISCNLGSLNTQKVVESGDLLGIARTAVRALSFVSNDSNIEAVPSIQKGNADTRAIGLGEMNLHGYFMSVGMEYGGADSLEFTDTYFSAMNFYTLQASMELARETGSPFVGFEKSKYATGEYFKHYRETDYTPKSEAVKQALSKCHIPTPEDWAELETLVREYGLYNAYRRAIAPTGSISYINNATACIHPTADRIEERPEGKIGTLYYAAPNLTTENFANYKTAYELGYRPIIDVYARANRHIDQGLSLTLFFPAGATTRDINQAHIYAWKKGIRTIYYVRVANAELDGCTSCSV